MKNSRVKNWVVEETNRQGITEKELAHSITNGSGMTPDWISVQTKWENREEVGTLIYDEILDLGWKDGLSPVDEYLIKK